MSDMKRSQTNLSIYLALLSTSLGAISSVAFKKIFVYMPYQEVALVESVFLCCLFGILKGWKLSQFDSSEKFYILLGSFANALGYLFFFISLVYLAPLEFSFLGRNQATISILFGFFLLGERHHLITWLAIGMAIIGSYFFTYVSFNTHAMLGILSAFLYCFSFAFRSFILKIGPETPIPILMFWGSLFGLILVILNIKFIDPVEINWTRAFFNQNTLLIILVAFLAQGIGIYSYFKALYLGHLSVVSCIRTISPFFVACYSVFLFDFEWNVLRFLGMVFCSASILLFLLIESTKRIEVPKKKEMIQDAEIVR